MTTPSGGLIGDATVRVTADTDGAIRSINNLATSATRSLGSISRAAIPLAGIGAAIGTSIPAVAGLAAAVGNLAPAATAAATGFVAIRLAAGTVQLAMIGVGDAVEAAFATGEDSAAAFQESLERLAPSARSFVVELRGMREELTAVQQGVQQRFFEGFAGELRDLSTSVLPIFRTGLNETATTLNSMALGASGAAQELAADGTLGRAIEGANQGLFNLRDIPAQVITAFGQLAAAGAPVFDRLTQAASNAATQITESLTGAAESGALEEAVSRAADLFASLIPIAQDLFGVLGNLFNAASVGGDDLFQVLGSILGALNQFTASTAFQQAIGALAETMGVLGQTLAPLLIQALSALAPIFTILGPPVQLLIQALGQALSPIIRALGPLLASVARAVGSLVTAFAPLLPVVGRLIAQLGPILTPIFNFLARQFRLFIPLVQQVAGVLGRVLQPILAVLPSVIQPILNAFLRLIREALPILSQLLIALEPSLVELVILFADLLVALTPLIVVVITLATRILNLLMPAINGLIRFIGRLASVFSSLANRYIRGIVMPAIRVLTSLLRGDFSGAFENARTLVSNVLRATAGFFRTLVSSVVRSLRNIISGIGNFAGDAVDIFQNIPGRVSNALGSLGRILASIMGDAGRRLVESARNQIDNALGVIGNLPERAANALGNLGGFLFSAGRELIQGFVDGILSLRDAVSDAVGGIIDGATGWLPGSPAERGPLSGSGYVFLRGQRFTEDFARGLELPRRMVEDASRMLAASSVEGFDGQGRRVRPELPLTLTAAPLGAAVQTGAPMVINFTNQGVIGSRAEVMDWLTRSLDQLSRQNRLPQNRNEIARRRNL